MKTALAVLLLLLLCDALGLGQEAAQEPLPNDYTEKVRAMRGFKPLENTVLGQGAINESVAAMATPLLWLNDHGYPGLVPEGDGETPASTRLMNALAESIGAGNGDHVTKVLAGLERYCSARGYDATIEYQGWLDLGKYRVAPQPDLRWILDGVRGDCNVLIIIARYGYDMSKDTYWRMSSTWMAAVGYLGANGKQPELAVAAAWQGKNFQTGVVKPLKSGTFAAIPKRKIPARPAAGWLEVRQRGQIDTFLIVDGAVRFRLQKHHEPEPKATP